MAVVTTETAFRALIRVFGLVKRAMEPHFARFGITGSQWGVLRTLGLGFFCLKVIPDI